MRLTDESKPFHYAVHSIVRQIPYGKATSYGHIAYLLGKPQNSRQVGYSMKYCHEIIRQLNQDPQVHIVDDLPWWRVVSSAGKVSPRANSNGEVEQLRLLRDESILQNNTIVDFEEFGWFPDDVDFD